MNDLPDGYIAHLPPLKHRFGDALNVPPSYELDRHQQTERTCAVCGAVKVTVHSPDGRHWREWRVSASAAQRETDTPPCVPPANVSP
jgi:hypothetical protein